MFGSKNPAQGATNSANKQHNQLAGTNSDELEKELAKVYDELLTIVREHNNAPIYELQVASGCQKDIQEFKDQISSYHYYDQLMDDLPEAISNIDRNMKAFSSDLSQDELKSIEAQINNLRVKIERRKFLERERLAAQTF